MKIALTGSSSTGKSAAADALMGRPEFARLVETYVPGNALELLATLGAADFDSLDHDKAIIFRFSYFWAKVARERAFPCFLTDRSFVDVAAYWIENETVGEIEEVADLLLGPCRAFASSYDLHFYFPFGSLPFVGAAQRSASVDLQSRVDRRIRLLLQKWDLPFFIVEPRDLEARVNVIVQATMSTRESG